ncbi:MULTISPECIES: hypothetical protein [unclassified Bradyrhizobium]|uniref:hypothetical protein n=1 Tax=unclassified Bradyrhizobium TaxID=2631580 RepID=UPI00247AD144|nr:MULTISPECIES: hypothetical protein [unclassified Bradyrhizobium]WGR70177.1 hypothetical protein MTX24_33035 [Bradyrhizobium sp. ISRA426]WGR82234.1 hypothetical protein MTX21_18140 [Bradyrhizobium sp. ISRA430]WGR85420.1 hypothetical protein MTX25_32710 [Bradyrhizobium sp. ISRA432]
MSVRFSPQYPTVRLGIAEQLPEALRELIPTICIAIASIGFAPILHMASPILAIAVETLIGIAIVLAVPTLAPAIAIFVLFFQNLFVSLLSPLVTAPSDLDFIKGYNFLACSVMWLGMFALYVLGRRNQSTEVNRIMRWGIVTLTVAALYFAIGFIQNGQAASVYLRNIVLPLFLFQLSLLTAATYEIRTTPFLVTLAAILILCGYIEFAFRDFWLAITNGYTFWGFDELKATHSGVWEAEMRATGNVPVDLKDRFSFDFLNTPLLEGFGLSKLLRIHGPNMSAISFGYGIAFFGLFLFSVGRPFLALAALPLLVVCSVKGALIMVVFVATAWMSTRLFGAVMTLLLGLLALIAFAVVAIHVGLQIGDYHVIGLMGGWNGFLEKPLGRGLGIGGNLSEGYFSIDWSAAQQAGTIDGAVESAIGVLLYQMGIAALVPLGFYFAVALKAWRLYAVSGDLTQGLAGFGVMVVLLNGMFQEEALFAPPALGLLLSLTGLVIGSQIRMETALDRDAGQI